MIRPTGRVCRTHGPGTTICRQMDSTTLDIVLVIAMLAGFALFGLAMFAIALRVGPTRGFWNQPAAELRPTGRGVFIALYVVAGLHLLAGLLAAFVVPGGELAVFVVLALTGAFYVACAHSWALAHRLVRRRQR